MIWRSVDLLSNKESVARFCVTQLNHPTTGRVSGVCRSHLKIYLNLKTFTFISALNSYVVTVSRCWTLPAFVLWTSIPYFWSLYCREFIHPRPSWIITGARLTIERGVLRRSPRMSPPWIPSFWLQHTSFIGQTALNNSGQPSDISSCHAWFAFLWNEGISTSW
jgi:hypothetical protein